MSSNLRRCLTVGVLAVLLATAGAVPGNARDLGMAGRAWTWVQAVWEQGFSNLWDGGGRGATRSRNTNLIPYFAYEGPGLDPNGSTNPKPTVTMPRCPTCEDTTGGGNPKG
ncbi:MAG TPA: hypothetical protein VF173_26475 [Thermoanaerobaculia bacterium]|nr:hypothetical protein [Thermoanaerobaculia bacterium]